MRHLYLVILVRPRPRGRPLPGPRSRGVGGSLALQATAATYLVEIGAGTAGAKNKASLPLNMVSRYLPRYVISCSLIARRYTS